MQKLMCSLPEPHPIDYDWRFKIRTVDLLTEYLTSERRVLAIGVPSVARRLEKLDRTVALVDRQPFQGVTNHFIGEPGRLGRFNVEWDCALVDPPWYPSDWLVWSSWAARTLGIGGEILVTIWPNNTRPTAEREIAEIENWVAGWAEADYLQEVAHYERPSFERAASGASAGGPLASSPREGRLLRLKVRNVPEVALMAPRQEHWSRFVFNDYQLALRLTNRGGQQISIRPHGNSIGWIWPFVSRRVPDRNMVDLWSSHNEVAVVTGTSGLVKVLRMALGSQNAAEFETHLSQCPELLSWDIPRPPYWRTFEWHHLQ